MITLEEIYQALAGAFRPYGQAEWTRRQCFPQTAEGEDLDKHAKLRGVTRRMATRSVGTVRFYVDQARDTDTEVPAAPLS